MYIIITRHCQEQLTAITCSMDVNEQNPPIMEFDTREAAEDVANDNPLCEAFGYQVVDVDL